MTAALTVDDLPLAGAPPAPAIPAQAPRFYRVVFLLIALPLFFSVGRYIPLTKWTLEIGILMAIGAAVFADIGTRPGPRSSFNLYIMLVAFGIPVLGAFSAYAVFGQPMLYGLATQRGCLLALFAYAIGRLISNGRLTLAEFERAFIILAWVNLAICAPVLILLDPNNYSNLGALVSDGGGVFNEFHLPMVFIILGAMLYFSRYILSGNVKYGLMTLPFVLYIVAGNSGRILNISLVVSLMTIAWIGSPTKRAKNIIIAIAFGFFVVSAVALYNPDKIATMVSKYSDAFAAVSGAYDVEDISANARIIQTDMVTPFIADSPIIGTGSISNEWNGGYQQMFGYFHPSDLGVIGLAFVYGALGVAFFSIQYLVLFKILRIVSPLRSGHVHNDVLLAVLANLMFMMVASMVTGTFLLVPEQTLFFFAIIIAQLQLNVISDAMK